MIRICTARKKDGTWCTHKAKYGRHCGYHYADGYHKSNKKVHTEMEPPVSVINEIKETIDNFTIVINELRLTLLQACQTIQDVDEKVTSVKGRVDVLDTYFHTIMTSIGTVTQAVSRIPIVGRFVT